MKKKLKSFAVIILFLAGLSLLLYPFIADKWNSYRQSQLMNNYEKKMILQEEEGSIDLDAEMQRAKQYNIDLLPAILPDAFAARAFAEKPDPEYWACLNLAGDGVMGSVEIPKIDIKIPIKHTTGAEVLQSAAGHLEGSSLPVGGPSTHAVLSAHRGLPSAALFTDLDLLQEGDHFLIHVLGETLCYQVDLISVVEPSQTEALQIEEGKDYVTLLTCTPYAVNSHRLLVRGHQVEYEPEVVEAVAKENKPISIHTNYLLGVLIGLGITGLFVLFLFGVELRRRKRRARKK